MKNYSGGVIISGKFILNKLKSFYGVFFLSFVVLMICQLANGSLKFDINLLKTIPTLLLLQSTGIEPLSFFTISWYLSAMMLAMLVIVPIFIKHKDTFLNIIAPFFAIFGNAIIYLKIGHFDGINSQVFLFFTCAFIRALSGISLGCVCYNIASNLSKQRDNFTPISKRIFTFIELCLYCFTIYYTFGHSYTKMDFILVIILAAAVTLSFSQISYTNEIFKFDFFNHLGKFSIYLYLFQTAATFIIKKFKWHVGLPYSKLVVLLIVVNIAFALSQYFVMKLIKWLFKLISKKTKKYFIIEKNKELEKSPLEILASEQASNNAENAISKNE